MRGIIYCIMYFIYGLILYVLEDLCEYNWRSGHMHLYLP